MDIMRGIIQRKTMVSMIFLGLSMLGYISYNKLAVELFPNVELPLLVVRINTATELDPRYVENQAVVPLEGAISTLSGIEKVESNVNSRQGIIIVYFTQNTNIKYAYLKLEQKIQALKSTLPQEFFVNIIKVDTEQINSQFMTLQVLGDGGVDRVRNVTDQEISKQLLNIDGVAGLETFGGREKTVEILLDDEACEANGITANTISNILAQNSSQKTYVGFVNDNDQKMYVNVSSELDDVKAIQQLVLSENGPLLLSDVADVYFGVKEQSSLSRVNGKDAVSLKLSKDPQANMIDVANNTKRIIEEMNEEFSSKGIEIIVQSNQAEIMENNIDQIINLAIVGGLLAIFVLWIFLKRIRLIFTLALSIPASIFTAFNFFYAYDISINSLTLIGMALAIGMLLDNSVVVIENIYRHVANGSSPQKAVVDGTKEVSRSVIAATLTTITVFLPFLFSSNFLVKIIGGNVGVSIVSTLLVSLVIALVLIPMAAHQAIVKSKGKPINLFKNISIRHWLIQSYVIILKTCLRYPARTIIGGGVAFFVTILLSLLVSVSNLSEVENRDLNMYITMPDGATLDRTDQIVSQIEEKVLAYTEQEKVISQIQENQATVNVQLKEDIEKDLGISVEDVKNKLQNINAEFPEVDISMDARSVQRQSGGGGGGSSPMESFEELLGIGTQKEKIIIKGQDFDQMKSIATDLNAYIRQLQSVKEGFLNVGSDRPETHLIFDQKLMSDQDITLNNVMTALSDFQKSKASGLKFKSNNEEYDITISSRKLITAEENSMADLKTLGVKSVNNAEHELQSFSDIIFASGISSIKRLNQEKQIELRFTFIDEVLDSETLLEGARIEVDNLIKGLNIPNGIAIDVEHAESPLKDFYFLIIAAVVIIFMILASIFESFYLPFVIMFSIPLAAIGAFLGLTLTGNSLFNANTLIGFLILLGVVVNNGIILIDYARILRVQGYGKYRALLSAGISRIRPISITTITTVVAMLPLAMGQAEYVTIIGVPFAITVMGGLIVSTFLTLVYIPTLSAGLESALAWIRSLSLPIKILQLLAFLGASFLIYTYVESVLFQTMCFFVAIILIPGATHFAITALKQANSKIVEDGSKMHIKIQNLAKVYGRNRRVVREWKAAKINRIKRGEPKTRTEIRDNAIWQVGVIGFLIYFTYFFLLKTFWIAFFAVILYIMLAGVVNTVGRQLTPKKLLTKLYNGFAIVFRWGFPLFNWFFLAGKVNNVTLITIFTILWLLGIWVKIAGDKIKGKSININAIKGRFGGLKRLYFRMLYSIPLIGAKKPPFRALNGIHLTIEHGMFGLLGPNGAGKTTLMRIICGILDQSYGKVWINGIDTTKKREELQGLIGYLPQAFGTYENMTPYDFLHYQGILKNLQDKDLREERVQYVLDAVHMTEKQHKKIGSFSGGMKQRIGIAQILLHLPKILVVDEPTAGLDPLERIRFRNLLVELSRERIVIFSTHIIEDIASSCNQVGVLIQGNIEYVGSPAAMAHLAENIVWEFNVDPEVFESIKDQYLIVHHMKDGDEIKIKCLADAKPHENARSIKANLEDAYLWLMKSKSNNKILEHA